MRAFIFIICDMTEIVIKIQEHLMRVQFSDFETEYPSEEGCVRPNFSDSPNHRTSRDDWRMASWIIKK